MNSFLKNYGSTLLLLAGLIIGGLLGVVLGENAAVLRPVGNLFLNLIFVLVVPLVFFSVAQSMVVLRKNGVIGKVLGTAMGVFLAMSLITGIFTYALMSIWNPFTSVLGQGGVIDLSGGFLDEEVNIGDALVSAFTVNDFPLLLSREHLLPLIIFASLFGLSVALLGQKVPTVEKFVGEGSEVFMKMMDLLMKLAPIGIGSYFADTIGQLGGQIMGSYLQIFLVVSTACAVVFFVFYTLCALYCHIPLGKFWKEMIPSSATAVGTCSSAACMPVNMTAARKLGVEGQIADGVIPLGTNLHKDGSVITALAKVCALFLRHYAPGNRSRRPHYSPGGAAECGGGRHPRGRDDGRTPHLRGPGLRPVLRGHPYDYRHPLRYPRYTAQRHRQPGSRHAGAALCEKIKRTSP